MEIFKTWQDLFGLRFCPITLIQIAFSAGTIYLLIAVQACSGARVAKKELEHAIAQQKLVAEYLHEIGKSWPGANKIAEILKDLVQKRLTPLLDEIPIRSDDVQATIPVTKADQYVAPAVIHSPTQDRPRVQVGHRVSSKGKRKPSSPSGHWRSASGGQPIQILPQQPSFGLPPPVPGGTASSLPHRSAPIPILTTAIHRSDSSGSSFVMVANSPGTPDARSSSASSPASSPDITTSARAFASHDRSPFQLAFPPPSPIPPQPLAYGSKQPIERYGEVTDFHASQLFPWPALYPNPGFHGMPQGQTIPQAPFWNLINMEEHTASLFGKFDEFIAGNSSFVPSTTGGPADHVTNEMETDDVSRDERNNWFQSVAGLS